MTFFSKINIENLFNTHPSTEFTYTPYIILFILLLFFWSYLVDFYIKKNEQTNKLLYKATRWNYWIYRWVFTSSALLMLISRLEWLPYMSMKFLWILYLLIFIWYSRFLYKKISKNYSWRLKNKVRWSLWVKTENKYLPVKKKK